MYLNLLALTEFVLTLWVMIPYLIASLLTYNSCWKRNQVMFYLIDLDLNVLLLPLREPPPRLTTECYEEDDEDSEDDSSSDNSHTPSYPLLSHEHTPSPSRSSSGSRSISASPQTTSLAPADFAVTNYPATKYHGDESSLPVGDCDSYGSYPMHRRAPSLTHKTSGSSLLSSCVGKPDVRPASERKTAVPLKLAQAQVTCSQKVLI